MFAATLSHVRTLWTPPQLSSLIAPSTDGYILTRLTAAKEGGETITVGGKQVALGIPQPKGAAAQGKTGVNSVPDIPLGRAGTADEAARAMLFLASPLAGYISGHTLGT